MFFALAMTVLAMFTPQQFGARTGDCRTPNDGPLNRAAHAAVSKHATLWTGDSCIAWTQTFRPPPGLVWRSDNKHPLIWLGGSRTDGIEVTGPIDLDGIVIDANRGPGVTQFDPAPHGGCPFGAHGSLFPAHYLNNVHIGRLTVTNGDAGEEMCFANLDNFLATSLTVTNSYSAGILLSGVNGVIRLVSIRNIGDLEPEGRRGGQGLAIFTESDPRKKPAQWYEVRLPHPSSSILPTRNLQIGNVSITGVTDTGVYLHDYLAGEGTGVSGITIGQIQGDLIGKDLFKVRLGAHDVKVGSISGQRIGAGIVAVEGGSYDVAIGSVHGTDFQYDAIGSMIGQPARFDNIDHGRGRGFGQTLSTNDMAIRVTDARNIDIGRVYLNNLGTTVSGKPGKDIVIIRSKNVKIYDKDYSTP